MPNNPLDSTRPQYLKVNMSTQIEDLREIKEISRMSRQRASRVSLDIDMVKSRFMYKPEVNDIDDIHRIYAPVLYLTGNKDHNEKMLQ